MKHIIILAGPTGSGKTDLVTSLDPEKFEAVSFDSRQIYKGMKIGTSQPKQSELSKIKHHLIDFLPPTQTMNASEFTTLAEKSCEEIFNAGKTPILVCGTGFYLKAFLYGMFPVQKVNLEKKNLVLKMKTEEKFENLKKYDPKALEKIHLNDDYRLGRALEVCLSGIKWSDISHQRIGGYLLKNIPVFGFWIDLERNYLYQRINSRAKKMLQEGFLEETEAILNQYGENCPGLKTLGYNFALDRIKGKINIDTCVEKLSQSHRNYAKKQVTWFRNEASVLPKIPEDILLEIKKIGYGLTQ